MSNRVFVIDVESWMNAKGSTKWEVKPKAIRSLLNEECNEISATYLQQIKEIAGKRFKMINLEFEDESKDGNPVVSGISIFLIDKKVGLPGHDDSHHASMERNIIRICPEKCHKFISFVWTTSKCHVMLESQNR